MITLGLFGPRALTLNLDTFFQIVCRRQETRGAQDTIKWLKAVRLNLYTFLAGNPHVEPFLSTDKDKQASVLRPVAEFIKSGDKDIIRLTMTLLQCSRVIMGNKAPDYSTVTEGPKFDPDVMLSFQEFVMYKSPRFLRDLKPRWKSPHLTNKMGPKGRAIQTSLTDLLNLPNDLLQAISNLGGSEQRNYMVQLLQWFPKDHTIEKSVRRGSEDLFRRLSIVNDTEGKSRVIAIGDYWSQTTLKPLHNALLNALRKWKECDVTFGQSIGPFGHPDHSYHSFDLSAATDRIPVDCYLPILDLVYGRKVSHDWQTVMTKYPFRLPESTDYIRYETGQPMGLYSSWVLLAHFHHLVIRYSAAIVGIRDFRDYRVLGDDVVIRHDLVAESYLRIKTSLGIGISQEKTLVSKDTFEFAKRFFYQECEVTGFPLSALVDSTDWLNLTNTLMVAIRRGFSSRHQVALQPIMTLVNWLLTGSSKRSKSFNYRLARKVLTQLVMRQRFISTGDYQMIADLWNKPLSCNNLSSFKDEINKGMYSSILNDIDAYVAKSMSVSFEIDRDLMIPLVTTGTTDPMSEYYLPLTMALNESVEQLLADSSNLQELIAKASEEGISPMSVQIEWSESKELRSFDPRVLDPRRRSEAAFHLSSTQLVRTLSKL